MKVYLSSKGISPDKDNSPVVNRVIETAKPGFTLVWKDGVFPLKSTLKISKPIRMEGAESTELTIQHAGNAVEVLATGHTTYINRMNIRGRGSCNHGFYIRSRTIMEDVFIDACIGNGIDVYGNVGSGSEASFNRFTSVIIASCQHGIFFQGPDANQSNCFHLDIRDCSGVGFYDKSFLGNQFFGCMAHSNKQGNYRAEDDSSMAGFHGCYSEGGVPPDFIGGHSCWIGGRASNGFQFAREGFAYYDGRILKKEMEFEPYQLLQDVEKLKS